MTAKQLYSGLLILLWLTACNQLEISPTPMMCNGYSLRTTTLPTCIATASGTLIQTPLNQQTQIITSDFELTVLGTIYIDLKDRVIHIVVVEGTSVITTNHSTQSLIHGQQVTISQTDDDEVILNRPINYDIGILANLPWEQLKRPIDLIIPSPAAMIIPTETPVCPLLDGWTDQYQIQSGDSLTIVAQSAGITVEELQTANCITNANSIQVGQILRVPQGAISPTQPAETFTPSAVFFRADQDSIASGDCTTLRWDIQNIRQLTLDGKNITGQSIQEICPNTTTTYTLTVDYFDDRHSEHRVTITVSEA